MTLILPQIGSFYKPAASGVWSIAGASLNQSFDVSSQTSSPTGIRFKPDGTIMFISSSVGGDVYAYSLSTAWDISTASYTSKSYASGFGDCRGLFLKPDGTRIYTQHAAFSAQGNISTAWDISTASAVSILNYGSVTGNTDPTGIFAEGDGTSYYFTDYVAGEVVRAPTATAWDINGVGSPITTLDVSGEDAAPEDLFIRDDGVLLFIVGSGEVNKYNLATAWDITSASHDSAVDIAGIEASPKGIEFKTDGTKMFIVGASGNVREYDL